MPKRFVIAFDLADCRKYEMKMKRRNVRADRSWKEM